MCPTSAVRCPLPSTDNRYMNYAIGFTGPREHTSFMERAPIPGNHPGMADHAPNSNGGGGGGGPGAEHRFSRLFAGCAGLEAVQPLRQVLDQVLDVLEAHGDAHQPVGNADPETFGFLDIGVGHGDRMGDQRLHRP